ncbi:MAG: formate dehydrogenase subunit gamma [Pseudomonadota bacterium]|nr:formate dehydrogenase subunit gamma [Pseudomonadota bacterium]
MIFASRGFNIRSLAGAVLLAVFVAFLSLWTAAPDALAQSSNVRPPADAVNAGPTGGTVPGDSRGVESSSEMWRSIRQGIQGTVSIPDAKAGQLVQSEGDNWRAFKNGPLASWGAWGLAGMIVLLAIFYFTRGRIRVEHGMSGRTITRFGDIERVAHWLLAVSFIILAITGLNITYGKSVLLPVIGKSAFASLSILGKWLHNYVAFAFIAGLVMVIVLWIKHNFPNSYDLQWIAKGGGMFSKGVHPPAKKFNAGQKVIFWLVVLGGISISLSGIALLFPFQFSLFGKTFAVLNIFGFGLQTNLAPVQEMQLAAAWHGIVGLFLIVVIIAHIYIGTIGMEGAFDAMGTGEVDVNWAKEHHSIWADEVLKGGKSRGGARPAAAPAE